MLIQYRKSLNMPRGKIIAQASHALGSFVLGCFDFEKAIFRCDVEVLKKLIKTTALEAVDDFDDIDYLITIEDHGRTVFKGIPTITCGLKVEKSLTHKFGYIPNEYDPSHEEEIPTRLIQIVDKQFARKDFEAAMLRCVIMQSLHLIEFMQHPEFVEKEDFIKWSKGSFAKIVLVAKDDFLKNLSEKNLPLDISWDGLDSCVIGPLRKEKVNEHTHSLKMM